METAGAALHDAYAAKYDAQVQAYDCYIADLLFGLCYEYVQPGERLLDAGIGTGLSSQHFDKAGLTIHGMDFSPAMVEICRAKGLAVDLKRHDLTRIPWPYASGAFDHVVSCGVLHFIAEVDCIFGEAARVLQADGVFAFTTRLPILSELSQQPYERQTAGEFEIFSHAPAYLDVLLGQLVFKRLKVQKCFVGDDPFLLWVVRKHS
jgi:predicted TPR repeat methyltransferase